MMYNHSRIMNGLSAAANQTTNVLDMRNQFQYTLQAVVTGTSTGTISVKASNDFPVGETSDSVPIVTNFIEIETLAIAGAGMYNITPKDMCYSYLRVDFTASNLAAGTITVMLKTNGY